MLPDLWPLHRARQGREHSWHPYALVSRFQRLWERWLSRLGLPPTRPGPMEAALYGSSSYVTVRLRRWQVLTCMIAVELVPRVCAAEAS